MIDNTAIEIVIVAVLLTFVVLFMFPHVQLLLYQGKMIQYANVHTVLSAYISTHSPHIGFRIILAMQREGVAVPAEAYRALCVALGRLSGRSMDGKEHAEMAEKAFQHLFDAYGDIAFTGKTFMEDLCVIVWFICDVLCCVVCNICIF